MDIFEQLKNDEGFRFKPYMDSVGKWTIGVGRNLDDVGLFQNEIELLLKNDVAYATAAIAAHLPWSANLSDARRGVLINMAFNMGITRLLGFVKFLHALEAGDYPTASAEMLDSKWAEQVKGRATRLARQIVTGEWQ